MRNHFDPRPGRPEPLRTEQSKEIDMELSLAELELIFSGLCEFAILRPEGEAAALLERVRAEIASRES
jgi:hypothetical protein